jgi:hypothetical protein
MPASTYEPLGSVTLTSAQKQITFTNIPQIYTDLVLVMNYRSTRSNTYAYPKITLNGDTASNYSWTDLTGSGSSAASSRVANQTGWALTEGVGNTATAGIYGQFNISIQNYSNSTTFKTILNRAGTAISGNSMAAAVGLYRSTLAVTSITIVDNNSSFDIMVGSTFSLYGVGANQLKATGGDIITTDGTYWYHAFRTSGTFKPLSTLSCDVLVIAGGGSGAVQNSGAGGAGGLRSATGLSISSATTVTVGAGGAAVSSVGAGINGSDSVFSTITSTGGGAGRGYFANGAAGGSGGGAGGAAGGPAQTGGASSPVTSPVQGYAGGNGSTDYEGGGGGGAGAVGGVGTAGVGGNGGAGSNAFSTWATTTGTGVSGFYAGGGGAGGSTTNGNGGSGGGGNGANTGIAPSGVRNTGSGGGSQRTTGTSGAGGSGLVIVRYAV